MASQCSSTRNSQPIVKMLHCSSSVDKGKIGTSLMSFVRLMSKTIADSKLWCRLMSSNRLDCCRSRSDIRTRSCSPNMSHSLPLCISPSMSPDSLSTRERAEHHTSICVSLKCLIALIEINFKIFRNERASHASMVASSS